MGKNRILRQVHKDEKIIYIQCEPRVPQLLMKTILNTNNCTQLYLTTSTPQKLNTRLIRHHLSKLLHILHLPLLVIINPHLLITLHRRIALEIVERLQPHSRVRAAEHGDWQIGRVG